MIRYLARLFWRVVPHQCRGSYFSTKYGLTAYCGRCGRSWTVMDGIPEGD